MRIVFLCGSLEQGRDGVGDYTRRLAIELIRQGHQIVAVSLNEKRLQNELEEYQQSGEFNLFVYRLPAIISNESKFGLVKDWIDNFDPEWISLQYVPYSFHRKGLPFDLAAHLEKIGKNRQWHIMFHELWVGISKISPLKHRIIGFLQKRIAHNIVNKTKPRIITTSNQLYKLVLAGSKIQAGILPLFSNISVARVDSLFVDNVLDKISISREVMHRWRFIGIFGNLYPEAKLERTIADELNYSKKNDFNLAFIAVGRMTDEGITEFKRLEARYSREIKFLHLGEQPEEYVSNIFQLLNKGISCTPAQHIGKSGVFAAMKLHGLEVLLPVEENIPEYEVEIRRSREELIKTPAETWSVSFISQQFIKLLKTANY